MSSDSAGASERRDGAAPAVVAVLLGCFTGAKQAARKRRAVEGRLRTDGNHVLETTVVGVDRTGKVSVRDPRRVLVGGLTSALTWGIFGLVSGGWPSLLISAALGAVWGAWAARSYGHHLTGAQLARAGARLPPDSSALLVFTQAADADSVLSAAAAANATVTSVASVAGDLSATILPGEGAAKASSDSGADRLSMVLVRYGDVAAAKEAVGRIAANTKENALLGVELVIEVDRTGRRRVIDPKLGAGAVARYNLRSWTVLGLVCGGLAGLTGGHGFVAFLEGGLVTGIAWGLFGAAAGALYGLWVGRAISARRLGGIVPLLPKNTSLLLAWTDAPPGDTTLALLAAGPEEQHLILSFITTSRGAVLALGGRGPSLPGEDFRN
jgi:uncharacterized membrane protein